MITKALSFIVKNKTVAIAVVLGAAVVGRIAVLQSQNANLKRDLFTADTALINTQARMDTTRQLTIQLEDSLRLVARLAVQEEVDDVGEGNTVSQTNVTGTIEDVQDSVIGDVEGVDSTSQYLAYGQNVQFNFDGYAEPVHYSATVDWVVGSSTPNLILDVRFDPANFTLRTRCGLPNSSGVRKAEVVVGSPGWMDITIVEATQEPGVCAPFTNAVNRSSTTTDWWFPVVGALAGGITEALLTGTFGYKGFAIGAGTGLVLTITF